MTPSITHSIVFGMGLVISVFTAATGANPVEARQVATCIYYYKVQLGDTCNAIVTLNAPITLNQLYMWNPDVNNPTCNNLQPNQLICVKA